MLLRLTLALPVLLVAWAPAIAELETRGNFSLQLQTFPSSPIHEADFRSGYSFATEIEFYTPVGENGSLTFTPFLRVDQRDDQRSHADFREFIYAHYGDSWEFKLGAGKVFWGVAESENLVDVINQTDLIENDDAAAKLGQPMINLLLIRDWGDIDLYILPGFRPQTFPGIDGRPRPPVVVDKNNAQYESSERTKHVDFAGRVSFAYNEWDIGAHVFHGTARDPQFRFNPADGTVFPFYVQQTQLGLDVQATLESWLLKAEMIYRMGDEFEDHASMVTGFEYSFYDIRESGADLGIVSEFLYDERQEDADQPFQNDLLVGLRLALNDEQSLEGLLGVISDLDNGSQLITLEGSRRFGSSFKGRVQLTLFENVEEDAQFSGFDNEDNLQLELSYFF